MCGPVQQWPTAQVTGDVAGFADSSLGSLDIVQARKELSVVEQAVGEVVGSAQLAQAADRVGEGLGGDRGVVGGGQPGTTRSRSARCIGAKCPGWQASSSASSSPVAAVSPSSWAARAARPSVGVRR